MSIQPLIDPSTASNAGGVAGRRGFRFQDHVAARFLLQLLVAPELLQVECETGDDIALRWDYGAGPTAEYVQVKITDDESKWSITELCKRTPTRSVGTSVLEKSLACDAFPFQATFRIISQRDVRKDLLSLKMPREKRFQSPTADDLDALGLRLGKKLTGATSPQGTTVADWTRATLWEHVGDIQSVKQANINAILRLAENTGECVFISAAEEIYSQLVCIAVDAGDACRVTEPEKKTVSKDQLRTWWENIVIEIRSKNNSVLKVYQFSTPNFFSELHTVDESHMSRTLAAYDAEFDGGEWRCAELAEYLVDWLPEITLPPRVLANHHRIVGARALTKQAVESIGSGVVDYEALLAHLLLHVILRHYHRSEPITCKLFSASKTDATFMNCHVVPKASGDQFWLGQSKITATMNWNDVTKAMSFDLENLIDRDFLRKERDLILQYREPQHLRSTTLEKALSRHAKLDDLTKVLNIPVLIAYDSAILARGYIDDYVHQLREEVTAGYEALKNQLSSGLKDIRVHVFLIPVQGAANLLNTFKKSMGC